VSGIQVDLEFDAVRSKIPTQSNKPKIKKKKKKKWQRDKYSLEKKKRKNK
jgi:hypothetical protein